jgi:hypothetical protein
VKKTKSCNYCFSKSVLAETLKESNIAAIDFIARVRKEEGDLPSLVSTQMGPRDDGYPRYYPRLYIRYA